MELTVTVSILLFFGAVAIPSYSEMNDSFDRNASRQQLDFDLKRLRNEAISNGSRGILTIAAGGTSYSYGFDELPYSNPPVADAVVIQRNLPGEITLTATQQVIYDTRGYLIDVNGNFTSSTLTLAHNLSGFCDGTIEPIGIFNSNCS